MDFIKKYKYYFIAIIVLVGIGSICWYYGSNKSISTSPVVSSSQSATTDSSVFTNAMTTCELAITNSNTTGTDDETDTINSFEQTYLADPNDPGGIQNRITFMTWLDGEVQLGSSSLSFESNLLTAVQYFANDTSDTNLDATMSTDINTLTTAVANLTPEPVVTPTAPTPAPVVTPTAPVVTPTAQAPVNANFSASIDNTTPTDNTRIHLTVAGAGGTYTATCHYKSKDTIYNGTVGEPITIDISRATYGYTVYIDIIINYNGQTYNTNTSFTPQ